MLKERDTYFFYFFTGLFFCAMIYFSINISVLEREDPALIQKIIPAFFAWTSSLEVQAVSW
jgi:hypothetical protein